MKKILILIGAIAAYGQTVSISDTLTNAVGGGSYTGRITVTLSAPGSAQPLYYSTTSLTGWQAVYCLGVTGSDCTATTAAGVFAATLYANSTITPAGTSYSARFTPAKGSPWSEVWVITPSTTTLRQIRATTVPTPTTTFQASQIVPGSNGQVLTTTAGATAWGSVPACSTCVVTSGSYADPAWITSLAGSKVSGNIAGNAGTATALAANGTNCAAGTFPLGVDASGNSESCTALPTAISGTANQITASASTGAVTLSLPTTITGLTSVTSTGFTGALTGNASTATALATPRTIAGVAFNGTANISIPSTGLSDTADLVRNNAATTYTAGAKQTFAHSATTSGLNVGVRATAPSSPAQGDVFFNSTLTRKGVYDGTQWRYELYAPSSGTGVVSWDGTSLSASTTLAGLLSVTSTSFVGALTGNASTATALASTVASGRLWIGQGTGAPTSDSLLLWDTQRLLVGLTAATGTKKLNVDGGIQMYGSSAVPRAFIGPPSWDASYVAIQNATLSEAAGNAAIFQDGVGNTSVNAATTKTISLKIANVSAATISAAGNVLIGTTTDLGYGLHAANKATNGNLLVFDPTATTGTSKAVFVAGQGQSGNLTEWRAYNATPGSGTLLHAIAADGIPQWSSIAEPTCNSSNRGKITMVYGGAGVLDTLRVCRKDAADVYAWTALY